MQPNERYDLIMQMLSSQDMVTIPELMRTFDISIETARRDLNYLEKEKPAITGSKRSLISGRLFKV